MLHVILNPAAGQGRPAQLLPLIEAELNKRSIPYLVCRTERPGHASELAHQAAQQGADILSVGGDGTLNEVLSGMKGSVSTLLIVPAGTGNDFVRSFFHLSKDPIKALCTQLDGEKTTIDYGEANEGAFLNVAGVGFDVEVLRQSSRFKRFGKGLIPYLLGVCAAIRRYQPMSLDITLDGERMTRTLTLMPIANGQYFGGGMHVAPNARIDDGFFDVVMVDRVTKPLICLLLPTFITGHFTHLKLCTIRRCREVILRGQGLTINVDGELHDVDEVTLRLVPGGLHVMKPTNNN